MMIWMEMVRSGASTDTEVAVAAPEEASGVVGVLAALEGMMDHHLEVRATL